MHAGAGKVTTAAIHTRSIIPPADLIQKASLSRWVCPICSVENQVSRQPALSLFLFLVGGGSPHKKQKLLPDSKCSLEHKLNGLL